MESILNVAKHLNENAQSLSNTIVDDIVPTFPHSVSQQEIDQAKRVYTEFLEFLGASLLNPEENVHTELVKWSKKKWRAAGSSWPAHFNGDCPLSIYPLHFH